MRIARTVFLLSALFICTSAYVRAQTVPTPIRTWKKRVARTIDMAQKEDSVKHHVRDVSSDSLLVQMFISDVLAGKLAPYSTWDASLTEKMPVPDFKRALGYIPDTITITDPVTGAEIQRVRFTDPKYDELQRFRVLEDWTFDPTTGRTEILIAGIGVVKEVYGDAGDFRGEQIVFWLKYNDARRIIDHYEQYHPDNTVARHIWGDYFLSDVKPKEQK